MNSLAGVAWALSLRGVSHLARICAICIADRATDERGENVVSIRYLLDFAEADYDQILVALDDLRAVGLAWRDNGVGEFACVLPAPQVRQSEPVTAPQMQMAIYVIGSGSLCKVGISAIPSQRLQGLQSAQPGNPLTLFFSAFAAAPITRKAEKLAHAWLAEHLVSNEWFRASSEACIAAVKRALSEAAPKDQNVVELRQRIHNQNTRD